MLRCLLPGLLALVVALAGVGCRQVLGIVTLTYEGDGGPRDAPRDAATDANQAETLTGDAPTGDAPDGGPLDAPADGNQVDAPASADGVQVDAARDTAGDASDDAHHAEREIEEVDRVDGGLGAVAATGDSQGHLHVSYTGSDQKLRHAWFNGEIWNTEVVPDADGVLETAIAAIHGTSDDEVWIFCVALDNVYFMAKDAGYSEWAVVQTEHPLSPHSPSMTADTNGYVYAAFAQTPPDGGSVESRRRETLGSWTSLPGVSSCHADHGTSMKMATSLTATFSCGGNLYWAQYGGASWGVHPNGGPTTAGIHSALAVGAFGALHVLSYEPGAGSIRHVRDQDGGWSLPERVGTAMSGASGGEVRPALAAASDAGVLYAAYPGAYRTLRYVASNEASFDSAPQYQIEPTSGWAAMVVTGDGVHIFHVSQDGRSLRHATCPR
jgi:hypothetical protein